MKKVNVLFGTPERAIDFIDRVDSFPESMDLCKENYCVSAKSILGIFSSNLTRPISLVIHANESQADQVISAISDYIV